ncbi:hypothetical protein LIER_36873 [Lithospermum erythrorhizon]|uniref:Uncharacterized protein n=1 Tax=Lithospermum erythrorhizon TaxID=34254 RepID=A0AAV3PBZ9_LITER
MAPFSYISCTFFFVFLKVLQYPQKLLLSNMARTKRTTRRASPPRKKIRPCTIPSRLSWTRGSCKGWPTWVLALRPPTRLFDCGCKYVSNPHLWFYDTFAKFYLPDGSDSLLLLFRAASAFASQALVDGHTTLHQQTRDLSEELAHEHLKVEALEQELQVRRLQVNNYPWGIALLDQDLKRTQEKEGLRRAYLQDSPLRCRHIGAAVLSDFVLNFQDRSPTLSALAEEYRQRISSPAHTPRDNIDSPTDVSPRPQVKLCLQQLLKGRN